MCFFPLSSDHDISRLMPFEVSIIKSLREIHWLRPPHRPLIPHNGHLVPYTSQAHTAILYSFHRVFWIQNEDICVVKGNIRQYKMFIYDLYFSDQNSMFVFPSLWFVLYCVCYSNAAFCFLQTQSYFLLLTHWLCNCLQKLILFLFICWSQFLINNWFRGSWWGWCNSRTNVK